MEIISTIHFGGIKMKKHQTIEFISKKYFEKLIEKLEDKNFNEDEKQNFILVADGVYHGIDNTTGDLWQEEFETLEEAIQYTLNIDF